MEPLFGNPFASLANSATQANLIGNLATILSGRSRLEGASSLTLPSTARPPAFQIDQSIDAQRTEVAALSELQNRLDRLQEAAAPLRGRPAPDADNDAFQSVDAVLSRGDSTRTDPSAPGDLIDAFVGNDAGLGTRTLEVLETAAGQQVQSASRDASAAIGTGGQFTINGATFAVDASDTIADVRDTINRASAETGVTAALSGTGTGEAVLNLQAPEGERIAFGDSDGVLESLGVLDAGGNPNETRDAEVATLRVDGLSDGSVLESGLFASGDATLSGLSGSLDFTVTNGESQVQRSVDLSGLGGSPTLNEVAQAIDARDDLSASVVPADGGQVRLEVRAGSVQNAAQTDAVDAGTTLADRGAETGDVLTLATEGAAPTQLFVGSDLSGSDSLQDVADAINASGANVTASTVATDEGETLLVESADGSRVDLGGAVAETLGFDRNLRAAAGAPATDRLTVSGPASATDPFGFTAADAITRPTNQIDDVLEGVTLDLQQAERGTEVNLSVERDRAAVESAVRDFVDAFNEVRRFTNAQREGAELLGTEDFTGALQDNPLVTRVQNNLNSVLTEGAQNIDPAIGGLRGIGIEVVDPGPGDDPLDANTLRINEAEFQDALENNLGDVREVFSFQADVSGPATFLGFSADTEGVDANVSVTADAAGVTGVSVGPSGAESPVAFEVSGRRLEIQSGELEGLSLFLDDPTQSADIAVSTDTGIASDAFFRAERLSDNDSFAGAVQSQIDSIQGREGSILSGTLERLLDAQRDAETRALEDRQELLDNFLQLESDLLVLSSVNNLLSGTFNTARRGF